jgi:DNA-binding CsgD family transcriptional regulator/tetratricopeptide (TPR) repeat protein
VELLERDWALTALAGAWDCAAEGNGRVVMVTGEPGIGKTWLVRQFLHDLGPEARVLLGTCDDLSIPRPFGPIRDLIGNVSDSLGKALSTGAAPHDIQTLLMGELELPPSPTVLVIEDVHWADDATLDSITVLGRRIVAMPALVVLTFRGGEVPPGHRLHATIGSVPADTAVVIELPPLSQNAVLSLAGVDAASVYAATGGNPFYVSEMLASRTTSDLPPSVANAVLGRASRLEESARRLVELVSIVPGRINTWLLDAVMPGWDAFAEEPERRQLIEVQMANVRFRHELARHAVESSIPTAARRRLHGEVLAALLAADADPSDIVHHAELAGAVDVVADYAVVAARRAAALQSRREAYSHYRRAAAFVHRRSSAEQAKVLEELATAAYLVSRIDESFEPIDKAIAMYRSLHDPQSMGRCLRLRSRFHWFAGNGAAAMASALEAIAILEPLGESAELAHAYSGMSQLAMLASDVDLTLEWGQRALDLATRLGDQQIRGHALTNIGSVKLLLDLDDIDTLLEAHEVSHAAGDAYEATRALTNIAYTAMYSAQHDVGLHYARKVLAYATEHEVHNLSSYAVIMIGWLQLRAGKWDEAERQLRDATGNTTGILQLAAGTVLTELAVRRGDADAAERLADLDAQAALAGELQRVLPVAELSIEYALTRDEPVPTKLLERLLGDFPLTRVVNGWRVRVPAWAAVAGIDTGLKIADDGPFAAMARHDWRGAADRFGDIGWTYDRALMLSMLDDEESLIEALDIARGLGADPLTKHVTRRLRDRGSRVPLGQRDATRSNPAGLTTRQLEVLTLVADGLTNTEIAERLVVSQRTAEHHVAAVLTKLGVTTRRQAARRAAELGLTPSPDR